MHPEDVAREQADARSSRREAVTAFRRSAIADCAPHGLPNYDDVCLIRPILDDRIYRCALKGGRLRFGTDIEEADDGNVVTEPQALANYGMIGRGPGFPVRAEPERFCGQHKLGADRKSPRLNSSH